MAFRDELIRLIDEDADGHIAFLSSFVRIPSPNPPGDTRDAVGFVQKYLTERGIASEIFAPKKEAPNLVSTLRGGDDTDSGRCRRLVLNGHIDHFPYSPDDKWQRDPYSGDVADGYVHGLGGVDMKAGTAASIIAFTYIKKYVSRISGHCTLEVVSDEETGGRYGTRYLIEEHERKDEWKGDCVLNAEPSGIDSIRFAEKGTLRMTFEVQSQGGHGAYVHRGEGAIRIATKLIQRLLVLEDLRGEGMDPDLKKYLQREDVRDIANNIMGEGADKIMLTPTVNIGTIRGGTKVNTIPSYCTFEADIRLPIGLTKEAVLDRIDYILKDFPDASYVVQDAATNPTTSSPRDLELVGLIQSYAELVRGKRPLPISSLGATDCKHFRRNGVPAYAFGVSPETMAEKDERVSVEEFLHIVKVHTLVAMDYLGALEPDARCA